MPLLETKPPDDVQADVEAVARIDAVPTVLNVICHTTGMRFAAVARVTDAQWVACGVRDEIDFGLKPGGELKLETTICNEIRQSRIAVVIDDVAKEDAWCEHPTPAMYGFRSYISVPIILADGSFFGTLCAIDPRPVRLNTPETVGMFRLFAELIARHLDGQRQLAETEAALREERAVAELRERFIAVLGHDLRAPACAITSLAKLLHQTPLNEEATKISGYIRSSSSRIIELIDKVTDLARCHLGSGLGLARQETSLEPVLRDVIAEQMAGNRERMVEAIFSLDAPVNCDPTRIAQLFSNLLGNALLYGARERPVSVYASSENEDFFLSVSNAGEMIPHAALSQLFQPFYRREPSKNSTGLGLGLYIADQIAKAHGGTLSVESTVEETRFTFRMQNDTGPLDRNALLSSKQ